MMAVLINNIVDKIFYMQFKNNELVDRFIDLCKKHGVGNSYDNCGWVVCNNKEAKSKSVVITSKMLDVLEESIALNEFNGDDLIIHFEDDYGWREGDLK